MDRERMGEEGEPAEPGGSGDAAADAARHPSAERRPAAASRWPHLPLRVWDLALIVLLTVGSVLLLDLAIAGLSLSTGLVVMMLILQSALLIGAVWLVAVGIRRVAPAQLGLKAPTRHWCLWAVAIALLTLPVVWLINVAVQWVLGAPFHNPQIGVIVPDGFSWFALLGMILVTGIVAPVAEELAFRGVLYGWLRQRIGVAPAVAGSALLFSLAHGIPELIPALAAQGVVLAVLYERSRSLWPSVIAHGTYNATTVILLYAALAAGLSPS